MRKTFTLAEYPAQSTIKNLVPQCHSALSSSKKAAFTLAEVLITLGVIGVVAAITMPPLITNIQSHVKAKRIQNIEQKFSKATDKMLVLDGMNGYGSTMNFVNKLKDHLKIAKICDNDNLRGCWPYDTVTLSDGKTWDISKTKTGKTLKMKNDDNQEWDKTVGIVTADGTPIILSYNTKCDMTVNVNPTWDENKSTSSNCVAAVFDWNGGKNPNKFGSDTKDDVIAFNANGLGLDCTIEVNGKCFGAPFKPTPITKAECEELKGDLGINECDYLSGGDTDYWVGAVKQCGGVGNMPTMDDLTALAEELYHNNSITSTDNVYGYEYEYGYKSGLTLDTALASSYGFGSSSFAVYSGEEYSQQSAYMREFNTTSTRCEAVNGDYGPWLRCINSAQAVCLVD